MPSGPGSSPWPIMPYRDLPLLVENVGRQPGQPEVLLCVPAGFVRSLRQRLGLSWSRLVGRRAVVEPPPPAAACFRRRQPKNSLKVPMLTVLNRRARQKSAIGPHFCLAYGCFRVSSAAQYAANNSLIVGSLVSRAIGVEGQTTPRRGIRVCTNPWSAGTRSPSQSSSGSAV
jgi:hypothetical protein